MEFCSNCGARLNLSLVKSANQAVLMLVCSKCGKKQESGNFEPKNGKVIKHDPRQLIAVVDQEEQMRTLPTVQVVSPDCQNNLAYVWQVQTRGLDEASTQFFRCTNCNHTFREYT